ncbi:MAG: hypothetical protein M0C28_00930 [Candidatus Moduliflexus flocculans]|nr:hypothetical protein [Candidatus Moduliflexus flocculans]
MLASQHDLRRLARRLQDDAGRTSTPRPPRRLKVSANHWLSDGVYVLEVHALTRPTPRPRRGRPQDACRPPGRRPRSRSPPSSGPPWPTA